MATIPPATGTSNIVARAKNIILKPKTEWEVIDAEPATVGSLYRGYIAPLAAIPAICTMIGSLVFGISLLVVTVRPSFGTALATAITSYIMALVSVYAIAFIINALAPNFGGQKDEVKALKVAAYSFTPSWLAGVLTLLPALAPVAALVGLYSLYLLYLGVPRLMRAPQDKAVGYVVVTIVAAIVVFMVVALVVGSITSAFAPTPSVTFG